MSGRYVMNVIYLDWSYSHFCGSIRMILRKLTYVSLTICGSICVVRSCKYLYKVEFARGLVCFPLAVDINLLNMEVEIEKQHYLLKLWP